MRKRMFGKILSIVLAAVLTVSSANVPSFTSYAENAVESEEDGDGDEPTQDKTQFSDEKDEHETEADKDKKDDETETNKEQVEDEESTDEVPSEEELPEEEDLETEPAIVEPVKEQELLGAASGTYGENATYEIDGGILYFNGSGKILSLGQDVPVPWEDEKDSIRSVVIGEGITSIPYNAFRYMGEISVVFETTTLEGDVTKPFLGTTITAVTFADGTETIPDGIFEDAEFKNCEIAIPASVTRIGEKAFFSLSPREKCLSVSFAEGSKLKEIGLSAFEQSGLTSITLPEGLETIDYGAFNYTDITEIRFPSTVKSVGYNAFNNCYKLTTIDFGTVSMKLEGPYIGKGSVKTIKLPEGITVIPDGLFENISFDNEDSEVVIPSTVTEIGNRACYSSGVGGNYGNNGPARIVFDNCKLTKIGDSAFEGAKITSLDLPDTLVSIGTRAFFGCQLKKLTIPSSVRNIGSSAFANNTELSEVEFKTSEIETEGVLFVGCSIRTVKFPDGITKIPDNLLDGAGYSDDADIIIPKTVKEIGDFALASRELSKVTFEEGSVLEIIDEGAFASFGGEEITLPESLVTIKASAFCNSNLRRITIPSKVKNIGHFAFSLSPYLAEVELKTVDFKKLGDFELSGPVIFDGCAIKKIIYPEGATHTTQLFNWATFDELELVIPKSIKVIDRQAFDADEFNNFNSYLTSLSFEEGSAIQTISGYAFAESHLKSVVLPSGLKEIGEWAFNGCEDLESVTFSATINKIGPEAFSKRADGEKIIARVPKGCYAYDYVKKHPEIFNIYETKEIKYVLNGGVNSPDNITTFDPPAELTLHPATRAGYTFGGWYESPKFEEYDYCWAKDGEEYYGTVKENITFYAKWIGKEYQVAYDFNDDDVDVATAEGLNEGDFFTLESGTAYPADKFNISPVRNGYTFAGWYTKPEGGDKIIPGMTIFNMDEEPENNTAKVYAHWTGITYTVRFHSNLAKDAVTTQKIPYGTEVQLNKNTFKNTGARFIGWNTAKDGAGTPYTDQQVVKNLAGTANAIVELYAQWKMADYLVFIDANGGTDGSLKVGDRALLGLNDVALAELEIDLSTIDNGEGGYLMAMQYGESFELTGREFTRKGYTHTGWKNLKTNKVLKNGVFKNLTDKPEIITIQAQWKLNTYKVTYNLNGGKYPAGTAKPCAQYSVNSARQVLPEPEKVGYTFGGWYRNKNFTGDVVTYLGCDSQNGDVLEAMSLFAKWDPIVYHVVLKANADTGFSAVCPAYNAKLASLIADGIIENSEEGIPVAYGETLNLKNYQFTEAGHKFNTWKVTWDLEGTPKPATIGATGSIKNMVTRPATITLTADWKSVSNPITYALNGGKIDKKAPKSYMTGVETQLIAPEKTGYSFAGWTVSQKGELAAHVDHTENAAGIITANSGGPVTLTANWTPVSYNFSFNINTEDGGNAVMGDAHTQYSDKNITDSVCFLDAAAAVERSAGKKAVVGFDRNPNAKKPAFNLTGTYQLSKVVGDGKNSEVVLYAIWGTPANRLTYNLNGGSVKAFTASYVTGKAVKIAPPTRSYYNFTGWTVTSAEENPENRTTFVDNGVVAEGYVSRFAVDNKKNLTIKASADNNCDYIFTANYKSITYKVMLAPNGKNVKKTVDDKLVDVKKDELFDVAVNYTDGMHDDQEVTGNLPVWTREGYTFKGFATSAKGRTPVVSLANLTTKANVTLYAIWEEQGHDVFLSHTALIINPDTARTQKYPYNINDLMNRLGFKEARKVLFTQSLTLPKLTVEGFTFMGWRLYDRSTIGNGTVTRLDSVEGGKVKVAKGYVTAVAAGNMANLELIPEFTENVYKLRFNSNGGQISTIVKGKEKMVAINEQIGTTSFDYTEEIGSEITAYLSKGMQKKGFELVGLALDAKGKNMIYDAKGKTVKSKYAVNDDKVSGLASGNGATATVFAIWQKVAVYKIKDLTAEKNGEVSFVTDDPAKEQTFELQCSSSIVFRNDSHTFTDTKENAARGEEGVFTMWVSENTPMTNGTYYVRVRQVKRDSAGNATYGAYSWPVKFIVEN